MSDPIGGKNVAAGAWAESPVDIAVAVVEDAGRFLVGLRPTEVPLAGYSEFPGGKVRPGETPEAAAARECREETGLAIRLGAAYASVVHRYDHGTVRIHFFAGALVDPAVCGAGVSPACAAGTAAPQAPKPPFRWVSREELATLRFPAANAQVIEQLVGGQDNLN